MPADLILHHFDTSPFSEKIRIVLGMKGLAWGSVEIPSMMPKPDYVPLTGGYRRTPALQIGADVYCDTQVMLAEIERRHPSPSLIPVGAEGMIWAFNWWADRLFFQTTVPIIFGTIGDYVPEAFIKDREQLSGRPFDTQAMKAAVEPLKAQWRAQAAWLNTQLAASASGWLAGPGPTLADAAAYMNVWFLSRNLEPFVAALTEGLPHIGPWREKVRALGHGTPQPLDSGAALDIAKAATPAPAPAHDPADPLGAAPGDAVFVMADDYGRDRVDGTLVAANPERIVIGRDHDRTGRVHVHFPRAGYIATKA
jgi:glutathione S-transferase